MLLQGGVPSSPERETKKGSHRDTTGNAELHGIHPLPQSLDKVFFILKLILHDPLRLDFVQSHL